MRKLVVMLVMMTSLMSSAWADDSQVLIAKADSIEAAFADSVNEAESHLVHAIATLLEKAPVEHHNTEVERINALTNFAEDTLLPIAIVVLLPLGIVICVFVYLHKRNKERTKIAQFAIEHGQDISSILTLAQSRPSLTSNDEVWKKGIRNVAIGAALCILLYTIGAGKVAAVGCFPLFLGIGQMVIAKTTKEQQPQKDELNTPIQNEIETPAQSTNTEA